VDRVGLPLLQSRKKRGGGGKALVHSRKKSSAGNTNFVPHSQSFTLKSENKFPVSRDPSPSRPVPVPHPIRLQLPVPLCHPVCFGGKPKGDGMEAVTVALFPVSFYPLRFTLLMTLVYLN